MPKRENESKERRQRGSEGERGGRRHGQRAAARPLLRNPGAELIRLSGVPLPPFPRRAYVQRTACSTGGGVSWKGKGRGNQGSRADSRVRCPRFATIFRVCGCRPPAARAGKRKGQFLCKHLRTRGAVRARKPRARVRGTSEEKEGEGDVPRLSRLERGGQKVRWRRREKRESRKRHAPIEGTRERLRGRGPVSHAGLCFRPSSTSLSPGALGDYFSSHMLRVPPLRPLYRRSAAAAATAAMATTAPRASAPLSRGARVE